MECMAKHINEDLKELVNDIIEDIDLESISKKKTGFKSKLPIPFSGKKDFAVACYVLNKIKQKNKGRDLVVIDPFYGTGTFLLASISNGFKTFGVELDNYTFFATNVLFSEQDHNKLDSLFTLVENDAKQSVMDLYQTKCECGRINYINKLLFDPESSEYFHPIQNREIKNGKNVHFVSKCEFCGKNDKAFDQQDMDKIIECEKLDVSRFPKHDLIENSRINITKKNDAVRYDRNFTIRAQHGLLKIQDAINKLPNCKEKDFIELSLVVSLSLAKVTIYGSSTENLYHVAVDKAQEKNVWTNFKDKFNELKKYNQSLREQIGALIDSNLSVVNDSFQNFLKANQNKFDIIYTDPPYTDQVPYLEKNQYYRDWLRIFYRKDFCLSNSMLNQEIVVSNSPSRPNKTLDNYYKDIDQMFNFFYSSSTDNSLLIFALKFGTAGYFNVFSNFINKARKNGYELVNKTSYIKIDPTLRNQSAKTNTIKTQILFFFTKLNENDRYWYIDDLNCETFIKSFVYNKLTKGKEFLQLDIELLIQACSQALKEELKLPFVSANYLAKIKKVIVENFFVSSRNTVSIDLNILYTGNEEIQSLFLKLYDFVPQIIQQLLNRKKKFLLDDLYLSIADLVSDEAEIKLLETLASESYKKELKNLLNIYCEVDDQGYYIKRSVRNINYTGSKDISTMDGTEFEFFIKKVLEHKGYSNVIKKGGSGDRGVDIIATDSNGKKVYIQCKRWIAPVDSTPIQRLHSMKTIDNMERAICVTSSWYSQEAKDVAALTNVELVDGYELLKYLELEFPKKYYISTLNLHKDKN